jgi:hypothetical protein
MAEKHREIDRQKKNSPGWEGKDKDKRKDKPDGPGDRLAILPQDMPTLLTSPKSSVMIWCDSDCSSVAGYLPRRKTCYYSSYLR